MADVEAWLGPVRDFVGGMVVGAEIVVRGERIIVTSVEVWTFQVVLVTESVTGGLEAMTGADLWRLRDDAATEYEFAGAQTARSCEVERAMAPPSADS